MKTKNQTGTKREKEGKGKGVKWARSIFSFFPLVCCGRDVAVTTEMLTGLYFGITIPCAGRQIASDKASPDWGMQERDKKWAGACPPGVTHLRLSSCTNTHAGKQITQIATCPGDFSQTNAQSTNTYLPKKKQTPPNLHFISLAFVVSNQMQNAPTGLSCHWANIHNTISPPTSQPSCT